MILNLANKTAVVTGGGSGIGWAITQLFARQGATVHVLELNPPAANHIAEKNIEFHACDVSQLPQVQAAFAAIGSVDVLVNNAGIAHIGHAVNTSPADFDRLFDVNVKGVYHCVHVAIPLMQAQGGGVILNMASVASSVGIADRFAYSMTKGAVRAMTQSIAKDFLPDNIRCNCISPARVHTPFVDGFIAKNFAGKEEETFDRLAKSQPIGRMGTPEEVAMLALFLCSSEAGFITGCDYPVDGGFIYLNN